MDFPRLPKPFYNLITASLTSTCLDTRPTHTDPGQFAAEVHMCPNPHCEQLRLQCRAVASC